MRIIDGQGCELPCATANALPESTGSGPELVSDELMAMCPTAKAGIHSDKELDAMLLARAVVQEMEMLNRHSILTEESLCHLLTTTQQQEAVWRDKVKLAESKDRQAAQEYHQLMVGELDERMALYNREAAQRSNFFRLYLLEKRGLDIMPARRHPVARGTRNRGCGGVALADFLETMQKMKAVEQEPALNNLWGHMVPKCSTESKCAESKCSREGSIGNGDSDYCVLSSSSSVSSRTTSITPPNAAAQRRTGFVHSPYSFDGPSEVALMVNLEDRTDSQSDCSAGSRAHTGSPPGGSTAVGGEEDHRPIGCLPSQRPAVLSHRSPACGAGPQCTSRYEAPQQQDASHSIEASDARPGGQVTKVEDEAGDDHPALPSAPQCTHAKHWKRLRAKRGIAVFVCYHCGTKWRVCSIGARNQSSGTSLRTTC